MPDNHTERLVEFHNNCLAAGIFPLLPYRSSAFFVALYERPSGFIVSYDHLMTLGEFTGLNTMDVSNLCSHMRRIRKVIRQWGWPVKITAHTNMGYSLDIIDQTWTKPAL